MVYVKLVFSSLIVALFVGCNYNRIKDPNLGGNNSRFSLPADQRGNLSYALVSQKVFVPKCISCHGTSGGISLESYQSTLANIEKIKSSVFDARTMPKRGTLDPAELSVLWTWIEIGAPEQAPGGGPGPTPLPLGPSFASIDQNIFQVKCLVCHSPGNPGKRILLGKTDLLNSPLELVVPGNPDESGLVIAIERADDKRMPPAKDGYSELKVEEKSAIREWILNGAVD